MFVRVTATLLQDDREYFVGCCRKIISSFSGLLCALGFGLLTTKFVSAGDVASCCLLFCCLLSSLISIGFSSAAVFTKLWFIIIIGIF